MSASGLLLRGICVVCPPIPMKNVWRRFFSGTVITTIYICRLTIQQGRAGRARAHPGKPRFSKGRGSDNVTAVQISTTGLDRDWKRCGERGQRRVGESRVGAETLVVALSDKRCCPI